MWLLRREFVSPRERPILILHRVVELQTDLKCEILVLRKELQQKAWGGLTRMLKSGRLRGDMQSAYTSERPKDALIERVKKKNVQVNDSV